MRTLQNSLVLCLGSIALAIVAIAAAGIASPQSTTSKPATAPEAEHRNSVGMTHRRIEPGTFTMGDKAGDKTNKPFQVQLTRAFAISVTEVTQAQWNKVMPTNPSELRADDLPVHMVKWSDAVDFCRKLSELEKRTYRLPTEAEWEYACRAGTSTAYSFGDSESLLPQYGWFNGNAHGVPQPVAGKRPNPWGLYDMHGNVSEWCADWYSMRYPTEAQSDPKGPQSGTEKVCRGGRCDYYGEICKSAYRDAVPVDVTHASRGFRVVLELPEKD